MMITIDPGEHNGISIWDGPVLKELRCLRFKETVETIESMLCKPHQNRVTLVYEVFVLFPWKSSKQYFSTFPAVEVIGVLKYFQSIHDFVLLPQQPSKAKFFTDEQAKDVIGDLKPNNKHTRDAVKHGLLFWKNKGVVVI